MEQTIPDKLNDFFADYPLKTYDAGELVLFPDNETPPVSYLVKGRVGQYDIADSGAKNMLTIYRPGAFFPMASAISGKPNKYFFEALEPLQLRQAPAEAVVDFLNQEPAVMFDLLRRLYSGMDGLLGRMSLLMKGTAESRLRYELAILKDRFGQPQADGSTSIAVTEGELAAQTGLARETVSRELTKLAEQGFLRLTKGRIILL